MNKENSKVTLDSQAEKRTEGCYNNQPPLFDYSVIAHATVENILCANSRSEIKEKGTMYLQEEQDQPIKQVELPDDQKSKKAYSQNWQAYNRAQINEKWRFIELLYELCKGVDDIPRKNIQGRNRIPLSDMVFACVFKTYVGVSGRRFSSDLQEAQRRGFITQAPHFNSLYNYFEMEDMFYVLNALIRESASPLKAVEMDFAVDSSGFSKGTTVKWLHAKYSNPHVINKKDWLKCHLICGVLTKIVTSVEVTDGTAHDHAYFKPLVQRTAQDFKLNHVTADKAYLSAENFRYVADRGGAAFIPFKENSTANHRTKDPLWRKMYYFFQMHRQEYMSYYHKRSNVETVFSMMKGKFGETLKNKTEPAQINELLCKVLCHNLCCVIHAMYDLGIEAEFYKRLA